MASLATPADLALHLGTATQAEIDAGTVGLDTARAEYALGVASGAIRSFCRWNISQETVTGALLDGTGERSIWLRTMLLTAVASVVELGVTLVYDVDYTWTSSGRLFRSRRWPHVPRAVQITYTHGYAVVPEDVKGICVAWAADVFSNPQRFQRAALDDFSFTVAASAQDDERKKLEPFRLRMVA